LKLLTPFLLILVTALFVWVSSDLPARGDLQAPASVHVSPDYTDQTEKAIGIPNLVSAILADFRSYDTLGETFVVFTAGIAVILVLGAGSSAAGAAREEDET